MTSSGYAGTPLIEKLGIRPGMRIMLINTPPDYYYLLGKNISKLLVKENEVPDLIHAFVRDIKSFESLIKGLKPLYTKNTSIITWISWSKKSAKIPTDLTEDVIRNYALSNGLVDVKVCAVSDTWSALKLVVPLKNRK